jgi:membrane protease YdiL (CAAX protease family)
MTTFQQSALLLVALWLVLVVVRFRRSNMILIAGLIAIGLYTLAGFIYGEVTLAELGLGAPHSWLLTIGAAILWLGLMVACSPLADRLAARLFSKPPSLEAFGAIQQSKGKLIAGILAAWLLGGILEELIARGIVLQAVQAWLSAWLSVPVAAGVAICIAAVGGGLMHAYQGPRAMVIITQLSILFGVLFVISGCNLWAVMLCHGLYDTIAFIRFAGRKSKYSHLDEDKPQSSEPVP